MSTQSLAATPSGYLQHGSYPIVDLIPQHKSNLSLVILSSQPMSTQSLAATPSGYLQHGSYPIVDLSPQHHGIAVLCKNRNTN
jgi:hypothetical protein